MHPTSLFRPVCFLAAYDMVISQACHDSESPLPSGSQMLVSCPCARNAVPAGFYSICRTELAGWVDRLNAAATEWRLGTDEMSRPPIAEDSQLHLWEAHGEVLGWLWWEMRKVRGEGGGQYLTWPREARDIDRMDTMVERAEQECYRLIRTAYFAAGGRFAAALYNSPRSAAGENADMDANRRRQTVEDNQGLGERVRDRTRGKWSQFIAKVKVVMLARGSS